MKKILSLVLVVAMMASLVVLAPTASAAENGYSIEVTDAGAVTQGAKGLTSDIIITTPDTLFTAQLAIDYDKTRIENVVIDTADVKAFPTTGTVDGFPYTETFFASGTAAVDASAGFTYLTVTYDIKAEAPAGDAYIRVAPVPDTTKIYIAPTDATTTATAIYDWTVIEGGATVLPKGYASYYNADNEFTWTDNNDGTCTITGYVGTATVINIPEKLGGLTVTKIGSKIFGEENADIEEVTIPATVVEIADKALYGLGTGAATVVNVLTTNAVIGEAAIGWAADSETESGSSVAVYGRKLTVGVTIYGYVGSTAESFAAIEDEWGTTPNWKEYVAPEQTIVSVVCGDNTSLYIPTSSTIAAPGASRVDGRVTVAWDVNGTKVAPGAEVAIDGDTTFTAITVAAPETTYGASVKAADGYAALRFTAEFSVAEYEALVAAFGAKNVKHGMLISTQDQIVAAGEFTHKLAKKIDFEMKGCWKVEDGNYVFAASVKNFSPSTLAKNYKFNAVAYVGIDLDGNGTVDTYVYGDYDWTCARDAKTVLANAIKDAAASGLVGEQLTWAETWLGKFTNS